MSPFVQSLFYSFSASPTALLFFFACLSVRKVTNVQIMSTNLLFALNLCPGPTHGIDSFYIFNNKKLDHLNELDRFVKKRGC
jgi:hypothetical protein